jgi:TonB family protein
MKKNILIFCTALAILGLTAFEIIERSDSEKVSIGKSAIELFYNIDSKFGTTITKEKLYKATSVVDILPTETDWPSYPIQSVHVNVFHGSTETSEMGKHLALNTAQQQLLRTLDYSDSFSFKAPCKGKHKDTGDLETYDLFYRITVTPEKETQYSDGKDALIAYLKENSTAQTANIKQDQIERGALNFTISKTGTLTNVKLASSSGYPSLDEVMMELINTLPGTWEPAENAKGDKVDQELVFSFGRGGC